MPCKQLQTDESGAVTGAICEDADGAHHLFTATKGVILACGDYSSNQEMLDYYAPDTKGFSLFTDFRDGSALVAGMNAGAIMTPHTHTKMIHGEPAAVRLEMPFLFVDQEGNRFMDETCCRMGYMNNFARPYLAKAGFVDSTAAKFFSLVPANWESYYEEWKAASPYDISQYNGDNKVNPEKWITADTIEGLAEAMNAYAAENDWKLTNIDAAALADTVARYNELCAAGRDEDFGKAAKYLVPIEGGPYYAIPRGSNKLPAILGGLVVDGNHQRLNGSSSPSAAVRRGQRLGPVLRRRGLPHGHRGALHRPRHHLGLLHRSSGGEPVGHPPSHPPVPGRRSLPVGRAFVCERSHPPMGKGLGKAPTRPPAGPVTCYNGRHGEPVEGHTEGEGGSLPVPAGHTALPVRARLRPRLGDAGRGGAGPRAAGRLRSARCLRLRVLSDLHRGGARRAPPVALEHHGADARSIGGADGRGVAVPHCGRHRPGRRAGGHCPCGRGRGGGRRGLRPLFASVGRGEAASARPDFLYTTASQLVAVVCVFFCDGLDDLRVACALVILPPVALLCLRRAFSALPVADRPSPVIPKFTYPWKIFVLLALYSFAYGLRQHQLAAGAGMHSSVSTAIVMAVLFASAYFFSNRFNIGTLYRSPLVLIVCGFLLVPVEGVFGTAVSSYLISMSYSLVGIIVALLLYDISKRLGVTVVIFAAIKGAEQVFVIWGKGVAEAMAAAGMNAGAQDAVIAVAVVAMMLAATLILLSEKELASRWGVRILDAGGLVEKTPEELRRDERAIELAEHARLTPRETEILSLVAQGKNGPAIMQELFIAEGTFKAHMSHIYEKCGVANRRELVALLGA